MSKNIECFERMPCLICHLFGNFIWLIANWSLWAFLLVVNCSCPKLVAAIFRFAERVRSSLPGANRQVTPKVVRPALTDDDVGGLEFVIEEDVESTADAPRSEKVSAENKDSFKARVSQEPKDYLTSSKGSKEMSKAFSVIFDPDEDVHNVWAAFNSLQRRPTSVLYESPGTVILLKTPKDPVFRELVQLLMNFQTLVHIILTWPIGTTNNTIAGRTVQQIRMAESICYRGPQQAIHPRLSLSKSTSTGLTGLRPAPSLKPNMQS